MEKEKAIELLVNLTKALKPTMRLTEDEHKGVNDAIQSLEVKKASEVKKEESPGVELQ